MKNNILPFSIAQIYLDVVDDKFSATPSNLEEMGFDRRHDFLLTLPSHRLVVRMVFANERCVREQTGSGVRRPVQITLTDALNNTLLAAESLTVNIKCHEAYRNVNVCLPVDPDKVDFSQPYVLTVRDQKTGQTIGEQEVRFFRENYAGTPVTELLKPETGGFQPNYSELLYKSIEADLKEYHYVVFYLDVKDSVARPPFLPEMEVRTYFPDGSLGSTFVTPRLDDDGFYYVSAPIYITEANKGVTYAELICFDEPIAGFVFHTAFELMYGGWQQPNLEVIDEYSLAEATAIFNRTIGPLAEDTAARSEEKTQEESYEEYERILEIFTPSEESKDDSEATEEESVSPLQALENLTGLRAVKEKLTSYEKLVNFNKKRQELNLPTLNLPLHAMFLGSPGTGKTTVAKRMGLMLKRAGVLSKGHVVVKERATLLGPYYSTEQTNTLEAIEEAQGGILFIDEAYQLYQPKDPRDPGKLVIEALMTALADDSKRDWMLILAGYNDEMKRMFEMNPGLKSRIPDSNIYVFDDFTEEELMEIAERYLDRNRYSLTAEAKTALSLRLGDDYRSRTRSFGNARHVLNMIQTEILPSMASRVFTIENPDMESLSLIQSCDIPQPKRLAADSRRPKIGYCA